MTGMDTQTMKLSTLLCLAICLVSNTYLSAQIKEQPVSILIHEIGLLRLLTLLEMVWTELVEFDSLTLRLPC